ncbi:MAG: hypothetical protein WBF93_12495 [Pirellulales bacterium]|nr:hypothetical protein [Pirellulales bacterium]
MSSVKNLVRGNADASLRAAILVGIENANRLVRDRGTGAATTIPVIEVPP